MLLWLCCDCAVVAVPCSVQVHFISSTVTYCDNTTADCEPNAHACGIVVNHWLSRFLLFLEPTAGRGHAGLEKNQVEATSYKTKRKEPLNAVLPKDYMHVPACM